MPRLEVLPDGRSQQQRRDALEAARDGETARALLDRALECLDQAAARLDRDPGPSQPFWDDLDTAFERVDAYLEHLVETAGLDVRCGPRCSACCVDIVPALPIEGLRLVRELKLRGDGAHRIQRSVEYARRFQKMILAAGPSASDTSSETYRHVQLHWRQLGQPCPVLADDGNCSAHAHRPLSCRAFFSIEDPAHCEASHPRFLAAERPPVWSHPREHAFEKKLLDLGNRLGLEPTPNLPWALARLHDHPLAEP